MSELDYQREKFCPASFPPNSLRKIGLRAMQICCRERVRGCAATFILQITREISIFGQTKSYASWDYLQEKLP